MAIVEVMMAIKKRCARRNMLCAAAVISLFSFFITATALLTGCSSDKDDVLETYTLADDENTMEITFTITVQDNSTTTRATRDDDTESTDDTWSSDYTSDDGDTYENTLYNITVLLLNSSNEIVAEVEEKWITESSTTGIYEFVGAISTSTAGNDNCFAITTDDDGDITSATFSGRIMILANMAENTTYSTTDDDGTKTFSEPTYSFSSPGSGGVLSTGIPMFGQKRVSFTLYPGIRTSIDDEIYLLRAMARVELTINNTSSSTNDIYFIGKASIKGYNTSGNIVPSGYYTKASTDTETASLVDTEDLSIEGCMNVPTSPGYTRTTETTTDSIVFIKEVENGDTVCYVYLPEYDYYSDDDKKTVTNTYEPYMDLYIYHRYPVSYTLNETTGLVETTYATEALGKETLYLQEYSNGKASGTGYDLVRNNIYGYKLTKTDDSELYVTTTASDWETVTTYLAWDADSTYIMPNTSGDGYDDEASRCVLQYPRWGNENSESWHTEDSKSFATYELSVQAANSTRQFTWQAYFTNPDYFYFNTNKSDKDPNSSSSDYYTHGVSCGVGRDSLYTIKIGPYAKSTTSTVTYGDATYIITTQNNGTWDDIRFYDLLSDNGKNHCVRSTNDNAKRDTTITYDGNSVTLTLDTVVAVYTDVFILATSASGTEPLNINHVSWVDALDDFTPYMLAGGTYEQTVSVDTNEDGVEETYTLGERQWFRLWWAHSKLEPDSTKLYYTTDLLQDIKDAGGCEWYTGK